MSNNGPTHGISFEAYMTKPAFQAGFEDAQWGLAFRKDYERMTQDAQWAYERGRQFGIISASPGIKKRKTIIPAAILQYATARKARVIP